MPLQRQTGHGHCPRWPKRSGCGCVRGTRRTCKLRSQATLERRPTLLMMRGNHLAALGELLRRSRPRPRLNARLPLRRLLAGARTLACGSGEPRMPIVPHGTSLPPEGAGINVPWTTAVRGIVEGSGWFCGTACPQCPQGLAAMDPSSARNPWGSPVPLRPQSGFARVQVSRTLGNDKAIPAASGHFRCGSVQGCDYASRNFPIRGYGV